MMAPTAMNRGSPSYEMPEDGRRLGPLFSGNVLPPDNHCVVGMWRIRRALDIPRAGQRPVHHVVALGLVFARRTACTQRRDCVSALERSRVVVAFGRSLKDPGPRWPPVAVSGQLVAVVRRAGEQGIGAVARPPFWWTRMTGVGFTKRAVRAIPDHRLPRAGHVFEAVLPTAVDFGGASFAPPASRGNSSAGGRADGSVAMPSPA